MAIRRLIPTDPSVAEAAGVGLESAGARTGVEWTAGPLRPVAHWVTMQGDDGCARLQMIWEVPDPIAAHAL